MSAPARCAWARSELAIPEHDPVHDDRTLFEFLILEGAQAGLSWETILRMRVRYRELFADFDPVRVGRFTPARTARMLRDPGIVRNRLKVETRSRTPAPFSPCSGKPEPSPPTYGASSAAPPG